MKTKIVKIGNSRGVRIPKSFLVESGIHNDVELELNDGKIIIKPTNKPRTDWAEAFSSMAQNKDDQLLDSNELQSLSNWDEEEWVW
ncbi:MAG: peptidase [Melioribacteraceae bacterium]|nr:MAG: peptidase [Melioribacteraceae bacterium]